MTERTVLQDPEGVTIQEFVSAPGLGFQLEVLQGHEGLSRLIRSPRIQKLGLALAGFTGYIHPDRIQIVGGSEMNYLGILSLEDRQRSLSKLEGQGICCILVTRGLDPPQEMKDLCRAGRIPLLRSQELSSLTISRITDYLDGKLAPRTTIHGVLLDVFGLGILLLGPSGIGKSECALELVLKGHRLVSDDAVEITRRGLHRLVGAPGPVLKHHMELRGLGIINIRELFGISATGGSQELDFAVRMARWQSDPDRDRLGLEQSVIEFLGVTIPIIDMPVAPGRNISTLVEVAARIHLLRQRGYQPAREITNTLQPETQTP